MSHQLTDFINLFEQALQERPAAEASALLHQHTRLLDRQLSGATTDQLALSDDADLHSKLAQAVETMGALEEQVRHDQRSIAALESQLKLQQQESRERAADAARELAELRTQLAYAVSAQQDGRATVAELRTEF